MPPLRVAGACSIGRKRHIHRPRRRRTLRTTTNRGGHTFGQTERALSKAVLFYRERAGGCLLISTNIQVPTESLGLGSAGSARLHSKEG